MTRLTIAASVSALALALTGCGNEAASNQSNMALPIEENAAEPGANEAAPAPAVGGQAYVDQAGAGDLFEIESARLAIEKAERSEVRELARMIQTDHQRSTEALTAAAGRATPPLTAAPRMNAVQESNIQALRAASGAAFGTEYLRQQLAAHEQALALVEGYAASGDVAPLREHAATVSGPIRRHLERVRALSGGE